MNKFRKICFAFLCVSMLVLVNGCSDDEGGDDGDGGGSTDLNDLPEDTGGTHTPYVVGSTSAKFGYYVYLPGGYNDVTAKYPLLIFLHGKGERGTGSNELSILNKVLSHGPPKLIKNGQWDPAHPMIVVSPQFHDDGTGGNENNWGAGKVENLKNFILYLKDTYRINEKRIYLTGLSHGGNGVFDYICLQDESLTMLAAAAPVAAYAPKKNFERCDTTPIWVFVGDKDEPNFTQCKLFYNGYNAQSPAPKYQARMTVFNDAGHDVWTRTYSGSAIGTGDPTYNEFDMSLTDWMFQYERSE